MFDSTSAIAAMLIATAIALIPVPVGANCTLPDIELWGTSPTNEAVGVPTDARVIISAPYGPSVVTANGAELEWDGLAWASPTPFPADAEVEVIMTFVGHEESEDFAFSFRTGDQPSSSEVPPPTVASFEEYFLPEGELASVCELRATKVGCADSDPPPFFHFTMAEAAAGWIIDGDFHSEFVANVDSSCADELVWYGYRYGCFELRAYNDKGEISAPTSFCPDAPDPADEEHEFLPDDEEDGEAGASPRDQEGGSDAGGGGCATGGSPSTPSTLIWIFALFALTRIRWHRGS